MDEARPTKRQKTENSESHARMKRESLGDQVGKSPRKQKRRWQGQGSKRSREEKQFQPGQPSDTSPTSDPGNRINEQHRTARTFSQPSIIQAGDKGIFVTCDKGKEKKSLLELLDLVQEYADLQDSTLQNSHEHLNYAQARVPNESPAANDGVEETDIEANIMAELSTLQSPPSLTPSLSRPSERVDLITLDVPCVSFLRLSPHSGINPVDLVHRICADAAAHPSRQKSRYVKRLTPVIKMAKVLNHGLENVCEDVLPQFFQIEDPQANTGLKYAIRPSVRNNDKLDRDQIIKIVGENIHTLGQGKHKVDLKGYEAGILVEVYRSWVGIGVVDNSGCGKVSSSISLLGYERLKRFNLAEIYSEGRKKEASDGLK